MPATLYLYADRLRIVAGRYEVNHPRKFVAHQGSTLAAHRAPWWRRYRQARQALSEASAVAGTRRVCFSLPHRDRSPPTRQWFHDIDRCTTSCRATEQRFFAAPWNGLEEQVFGATYIEHFLQHSLVFQEEIP